MPESEVESPVAEPTTPSTQPSEAIELAPYRVLAAGATGGVLLWGVLALIAGLPFAFIAVLGLAGRALAEVVFVRRGGLRDDGAGPWRRLARSAPNEGWVGFAVLATVGWIAGSGRPLTLALGAAGAVVALAIVAVVDRPRRARPISAL